MWDPSSPTRTWTCTSCIGRPSPNHWVPREVPTRLLIVESDFKFEIRASALTTGIRCLSHPRKFHKPYLSLRALANTLPDPQVKRVVGFALDSPGSRPLHPQKLWRESPKYPKNSLPAPVNGAFSGPMVQECKMVPIRLSTWYHPGLPCPGIWSIKLATKFCQTFQVLSASSIWVRPCQLCWAELCLRLSNSVYPGPQNVPLFGNSVFADIICLGWGHTGLGWALNPVSGVLTGERDLETHRKKGHVRTEAGTGVMQLPARESQRLLGASRIWSRHGRTYTGGFRNSRVLQTPWLWTLDSRTERE